MLDSERSNGIGSNFPQSGQGEYWTLGLLPEVKGECDSAVARVPLIATEPPIQSIARRNVETRPSSEATLSILNNRLEAVYH